LPILYFTADLGVQRGILRWFLSLHSPTYSINISPDKVKSAEEKKAGAKATPKGKGKGKGKKGNTKANEDALPVFGEASGTPAEITAYDASSVPPGPVSVSPLKDSRNAGEEVGIQAELASLPTPFTPSINRTLNAAKGSNGLPPLPDGLTVAILRSRLDPKKKIK
jgi:DNA-3-methyladenine glycosylase II